MGLWDVVKDGASAVGGAIKDGAEVVGDALKEGADAVEDIGDGAGSWIADELCATGNDVLCGAGSVMGGLVSGELGFVGGIIRAGDQIWIAGTSAIGDSLQGRWRDALDDFEALVLAGAVLGVELPGWLLGPIDESIRHWQRNQLRKFVSGLIDTKYRDVPSQRAAVRTATGVDNRPWGMEVSATHRLLAFDSFNLPLDALHDNGVINLYDLAGIEYEKRKNQPEARVLAAHGPNLDPTNLAGRDDIDSYLNTGTPGLKILAMSPKNAARSTPYATRICKDVGILIDWRDTEFAELTVTFRSEGVRVIRTPVQAPKAKAHAERWVGSLRRECLDRLLILGRRHLEQVVRAYISHHNEHRPHRSLAQRPPLALAQPPPPTPPLPNSIGRRDRLGGVLHEYYAIAA